MQFVIGNIATVYNVRKEATDDHWGQVISEIRLNADIPEDALDGIEDFSHAEILYIFDKAINEKMVTGSEHPRANTSWPKVGIFSQRKKNRPNHLGATICKILKREGRSLFVQMLDAIDGTPVVDIKPVMNEFLPGSEVRQPGWTTELMKDYWK